MDAFDAALSGLSDEIQTGKTYAHTNLLFLDISEKSAHTTMATLNRDKERITTGITNAEKDACINGFQASVSKLLDVLLFSFSVILEMREIKQ